MKITHTFLKINMKELIISLNDNNFESRAVEIFKKYGVLAVTDVFDEKFCNDKMDEIVSAFEYLGTNIDRNNIKETWTKYNLPPQTRPGMFQVFFGHLQGVWDIRNSDSTHYIFSTLYSALREENITEFATSFDGMFILPRESGQYAESSKDWAHIDQTFRKQPFACIQGEAVLTNTTAAFRCTPGSCHIYEKFLDEEGIGQNDKSNWCKFKNVNKIKEICEKKNLKWQIPLRVPKGSMIFWTSTTIHSAMYPSKNEKPDPRDFWKGWRGVVYVCFRPKKEFTKRALKQRKKNLENNRLTYHWGDKTVPKTPGGRFLYMEKRHEEIEKYIKNPELLYETNPYPVVNEDLV